MFCNKCGTEIAPGSNLCSNCARAMNLSSPMIGGPSRLERHLRTLGILWMVGSGILLLSGICPYAPGLGSSLLHSWDRKRRADNRAVRSLSSRIGLPAGERLRNLRRLGIDEASILGAHCRNYSGRHRSVPLSARYSTRRLHALGLVVRRRYAISTPGD